MTFLTPVEGVDAVFAPVSSRMACQYCRDAPLDGRQMAHVPDQVVAEAWRDMLERLRRQVFGRSDEMAASSQ